MGGNPCRPTHLIVLVTLALLALRTGRIGAAWWNNRAARHLNTAQIAPDLTDADRYTAAVAAGHALERALRFDPAFGKAYTNLGDAYTTLGDVRAAAQALSEATRIAPGDWRAHFFLGQALAALGRETEARAAWRAAGAARYFIHRYEDLKNSDPTTALLEAQRAHAVDTGGIQGALVLGQALTAQQAYTDALTLYEDAIARAPSEVAALAKAHAEMGTLLYVHLGRSTEGAAALEQAIVLQPKDEGPRLTLAEISSERGACYEAESWLTPLFEQPSSPARRAQANVLVGRCLLTLERPQTAIPYFERATADEPTSPTHWLLLGQAARAAGELEAAIDAYTQALTLNPDHAGAQSALAELQESAP
jgi:tetratricopeptide (TPR) repeat protein